eukprot:scaffold136_cov325-Pavlova_lutheri.AAC.2
MQVPASNGERNPNVHLLRAISRHFLWSCRPLWAFLPAGTASSWLAVCSVSVAASRDAYRCKQHVKQPDTKGRAADQEGAQVCSISCIVASQPKEREFDCTQSPMHGPQRRSRGIGVVAYDLFALCCGGPCP